MRGEGAVDAGETVADGGRCGESFTEDRLGEPFAEDAAREAIGAESCLAASKGFAVPTFSEVSTSYNESLLRPARPGSISIAMV